MDWLANLSAQRLLSILVALSVLMWIGGKVGDKPVSDSQYLILFGFFTGIAIIDHLHGIRQALERKEK